ncbi:MAG: hypothetical protein WD887_00385 [Candidatus Saccharimonadales bacterium]
MTVLTTLLTALPSPLFAAPCAKPFFFFIPSWWEYLPTIDTPLGCKITFNPPGDIWLVGLAVLDILLRLAGFIAVISIIIAGVSHIFSGGNPEKAASARKRLYNSLIGLAVALIATAFVTFLGRSLGG